MASLSQWIKRPPDQSRTPDRSPRIVSISRHPSNHIVMWLVTDPQQQRHYFTVTQAAETLHCACQAGQVRPSSCPHLRAVQAWLNTHRQQGHNSISLGKPEICEQPLSWSDDKAFSIWKS